MKREVARDMRGKFIPHEKERAQKILLNEFSEVFRDLPAAVSTRLLKLCRAETYGLNSRVLTASMTKPDKLYLVCQGQAVSTKSQNYYNRFCDEERKAYELSHQQKFEDTNPKFSSLFTIGWVILAFCMRNQAIQHMIREGARRIVMERLTTFIMMEQNAQRTRLSSGSYFGNLTETKGKSY